MAIADFLTGRQSEEPEKKKGGIDAFLKGIDQPAAPQEQGGPGLIDRLSADFMQLGGGLNRSIAGTVGAIPDAVNWALNKMPDPIPFGPRVPRPPDAYTPGGATRAAQQGINAAVGTPPPAQGPEQNMAAGTGQGIGDFLSMFLPGMAAAKLGKAGGMAAGIGDALTSRPGLQALSGATGGAVGQATGSPIAGAAASLAPLAPSMLGAGIKSAMTTGPALNAEQQRLKGVLGQSGVQLTPGQAAGSKPLTTLESVFETLPMTSGAALQQRQKQFQQFTDAALAKAGQAPGSLADPETLREIKARLGGRIGELASQNNMIVTPQVATDLATVQKQALKFLPDNVAKPVVARIEEWAGLVQKDPKTGQHYMPGPTYQAFDSSLGKQIRGTMDGGARGALGEVRDFLRQSMDNSISPEHAAEWKDLRQKYANLQTVAKAMDQPSGISASGYVAPAKLAQAARTPSMKSNAFGYGDMRDLGAAGQQFLKEPPNSFSADRKMWMQILAGGGGLLAAGPLGAAGAVLGPRLAQAGYNSGAARSYLSGGPSGMAGLLSGALGAQAKGRNNPDPISEEIDRLSYLPRR